MRPRRKDMNQKAAEQVAKLTKTPLPRGEDLLGSEELKAALRKAKASEKRRRL